MKRILAFLVAIGLCAAPLAAQTRSADNHALVSVTANLTLFGGHDLDFGAHFASEGVVASQGSQFAQWTGFTDPGNSFTFSLVLPSSLAKVSGATNGPVPFVCGSQSLYITNTTLNSRYDPSVPAQFGPVTPPGDYSIRLGWRQDAPNAAQSCTVDLSGRAAGNYAGTITLTITIV